MEALDAVATSPSGDHKNHLKEELGDLLLQVLLHAEIARENGDFSINEVAIELAEKLVRRHPHVFGKKKLASAEEVSGQWERNKREEKPERESVLEGIPASLPALLRAEKVIAKVSKIGFQWPNLTGPLEKMREELAEFEAELNKAGKGLNRESSPNLPVELRQKLELELGDLLFTVANVAYFLHLNPEDALRSMLARFENRFRKVEKGARDQEKKLEEMSLDEMDELWNQAKKSEKS